MIRLVLRYLSLFWLNDLSQTLAVALSAVAKRHLDQGQVTNAIAAYTRAIETEESDGRLFNRAVCHVQNDNPSEAIVCVFLCCGV